MPFLPRRRDSVLTVQYGVDTRFRPSATDNSYGSGIIPVVCNDRLFSGMVRGICLFRVTVGGVCWR